MQRLLYRNPLFDLTECSGYDLSIQAGLDGYAVLIKETLSANIVFCSITPAALSHHTYGLKVIGDLISADELPEQTFANSVILFSEPRFCLVPESVYTDKLVDHLLAAGQKSGEEKEKVTVPFHQLNALLAFTAGKELFDLLTSRFPGAPVTHEIYPIIGSILSDNNPVLRFHLHNSWFYAIGYTGGQVVFLNSFEYRHENDLVFFMLSVLEQPELKELPVTLSGWIDSGDPHGKAVRKYLPRAEWVVARGNVPAIPAEIPYHYLPGLIFT